jgi:hypothetical protein
MGLAHSVGLDASQTAFLPWREKGRVFLLTSPLIGLANDIAEWAVIGPESGESSNAQFNTRIHPGNHTVDDRGAELRS